MTEIVILSGADSDLIEHFGRFDDAAQGMGERFDLAFLKSCRLLEKHPRIGPRYGGVFRRLLMLDWNLGIFYEVSGSRVLVHAIMDVRQDPENITRRLGLR
jgi:plasmid stabilization system protein ParE